MSINPSLLQDLLERAMGEELGLVVECNNPHQTSMLVHTFIRESAPHYAEHLVITVPSTPDTIVICRRTVELDAPIGEPGDLPDV